LAIKAGILAWTDADIDIAIIACMRRWINQRGNTDTAGELLRDVQQVRQTVAATFKDHFIHLCLKNRRLVPASPAAISARRRQRRSTATSKTTASWCGRTHGSAGGPEWMSTP
jgi:hypothetical protein